MLTHVVFGAGVVSALFASLPFDVRLPLAGASSILVNFVVDAFGHTRHGGFVARSPLTHSVVTAPVWGGALGYVLWAAGMNFGLVGASLEEVFLVGGVVAALAHLFLDSMTEKGVYFITNRFALTHFGSGNSLLNAGFVACGLALLLV